MNWLTNFSSPTFGNLIWRPSLTEGMMPWHRKRRRTTEEVHINGLYNNCITHETYVKEEKWWE